MVMVTLLVHLFKNLKAFWEGELHLMKKGRIFIILLFIGHRRTARSSQRNHLKTPETNFPAPFRKFCGRKIKRIPKFDEHIQRH